ncbi:MAG TPA: HAD-IIIA family hydrolase [Gemmatimonadales bacterium]|nr:HAD-IIIA family hydrolase [Gemmatimonadales bacterium]
MATGKGHVLARRELWIFDADDTLRRTTVPGQPCPRGAGEWTLLPGVRETLHAVRWNAPGWPKLGLASNQDQIGAGLLTRTTARGLLRALAHMAAGVIPPEPAIQLCPHALGIACECRKPRPGMLDRIMVFYGVAADATAMVGDSEADQGAAAAAGVAFIHASDLFGWRQTA